MTREQELEDLVRAFVLNEIDYMTRNALGDPEKQHNIRWARQLGITETLPDQNLARMTRATHEMRHISDGRV